MYELLWLLLPVAAASGWLAATHGARGAAAPPGPPPLRSDYFRGLNYLLDEQPDKAIELFVKVLEVDSETVETHLALGNLFRLQGFPEEFRWACGIAGSTPHTSAIRCWRACRRAATPCRI